MSEVQDVETGVLQEIKAKKLEVNPLQIRTKATEGYRTLLAESPEFLPWSQFVLKVAQSGSDSAPVFRAIAHNTHRMVDIRKMSWAGKKNIKEQPDSMHETLKNWRKDQIAVIAEDLTSIDIIMTPTQLEAPLPQDPSYGAIHNSFIELREDPEEGLLGIMANVQKEFAGVVHATRVYEEARLIMEICLPDVPWPKEEALYFTSDSWHLGLHANAGWLPRVSKGIILALVEPLGDIDQYIRELKRTDLTIVGQEADKFIYAVHEVGGHGGFAELFQSQEVQEVFGANNPAQTSKEARLADSLTEGYAMLMEDLAAEVSYSNRLGSGKFFVDIGLSQARKRRTRGLLQMRRHPEGRRYSDGFRLMRQLMRQMGIDDLPGDARIIKLREFLGNIDLKKAAELKPDNPNYQLAIRDPLHQIPKKQSNLQHSPDN